MYLKAGAEKDREAAAGAEKRPEAAATAVEGPDAAAATGKGAEAVAAVEPRASAAEKAEEEQRMVPGAKNVEGGIQAGAELGSGEGAVPKEKMAPERIHVVNIHVLNIGRAAGRGRAAPINGLQNPNGYRSVVHIAALRVRLWTITFA